MQFWDGKYWLRSLWTIAILTVVAGELVPGNSLPMQAIGATHINDKVLHFVAYLVLAWFPAWNESRSTSLWLCAGLVGMGILLEIVQSFVGRSCEVLDATANLAGVICGYVVSSRMAAGLGRVPGTSKA